MSKKLGYIKLLGKKAQAIIKISYTNYEKGEQGQLNQWIRKVRDRGRVVPK